MFATSFFEIVPEMWMMDAKEVEEAQTMRSCSKNSIITMLHTAGGGTGNNTCHHVPGVTKGTLLAFNVLVLLSSASLPSTSSLSLDSQLHSHTMYQMWDGDNDNNDDRANTAFCGLLKHPKWQMNFLCHWHCTSFTSFCYMQLCHKFIDFSWSCQFGGEFYYYMN